MGHETSTPREIIKAASACVWRGDEVLLVQRAKAWGFGFWSLPGGKIEAGEEALAAAQRELSEETGIVADLSQCVGIFALDGQGVSYEITCFTGTYMGGEAVAATDAMAVVWQHHTKFSELKLAPNTAEAIARARQLLGL
jgi:8-oxo-dGTP diphosphatase